MRVPRRREAVAGLGDLHGFHGCHRVCLLNSASGSLRAAAAGHARPADKPAPALLALQRLLTVSFFHGRQLLGREGSTAAQDSGEEEHDSNLVDGVHAMSLPRSVGSELDTMESSPTRRPGPSTSDAGPCRLPDLPGGDDQPRPGSRVDHRSWEARTTVPVPPPPGPEHDELTSLGSRQRAALERGRLGA